VRLRTHILLWVLFAAVLPLALLGIAANDYLEGRFRRELGDQVDVNLRSALSAIEREVVGERTMLRGLAATAPVRGHLPVLDAASRGWMHPLYYIQTAQLIHFLESFQVPVGIYNVLRVMDADGHTLVKIRGERHVPPDFIGLDGVPRPEEEVNDPAFVARLAQIPADGIGFESLPQNRRGIEPPQRLPMLDTVVPLELAGRRSGYLAATTWGVHIDRALELVPRLFGARLLLVELDEDDPARHGLLLYDDTMPLRFTDQNRPPVRLSESYPEEVWQHLAAGGSGRWSESGGQRAWFQVEIYPYPDRLKRWVLAAQVDEEELAAPIARLRMGILASAALALLMSLGLAQWGAQQIAAPVDRLAHDLEVYADGDPSRRATASGVAEVRRVATAFNYMGDRLEQAAAARARAERELQQHARLASIGRMAAGLAHEINNPLNNVLAFLKLAERGLPEGDSAACRDLHAARDEALRAAAIIRGVLDFSRQAQPQAAPFAVTEWLQAAVAAVETEAEACRVSVELDDRSGTASCTGDRGQLLQVMVNLLRNAIQASSPEERVIVTGTVTDDELRVAVRDHGSGIAPEARERLFEPFFTTKPVGVGTGLGLAVSHGLVEQHGGSLVLEDHPDGGAEALLRLPRNRQEEA